ncbi:MAG: hypothetical protein KatS3mg054_0153 [Chloroflexus sp.]|nr:MAG: hypothetical protein KatS3mg054_0153 [Chloroflexus sp.]
MSNTVVAEEVRADADIRNLTIGVGRGLLIVKPTISMWSGTVSDTNEARRLDAERAVQNEKYAVQRRFSASLALRKLNSLRTRVLTELDELTWDCGGLRITNIANRPHIEKLFADNKAEFDALAAQLVAEYSKWRSDLLQMDFQHASVWPSVGRVKDKFRWGVILLPVPKEGDWLRFLSEVATAVKDDVITRLSDKLKSAAERLLYAKRIHGSVILSDALRTVGSALGLGFSKEFEDILVGLEEELQAVAAQATVLTASDTEGRTEAAERVLQAKKRLEALAMGAGL